MKLTSKQAKFVKAYVADPQAKKAALKAGYSAASASVEACRLLKNPNVLAAIDAAKNPRPMAQEVVLANHNIQIGKTPLDYMLGVMNDELADAMRRDKMAAAAAPYVHLKKGEGGKKDERQDAAKSASKGRFGASQPPKLVINNR